MKKIKKIKEEIYKCAIALAKTHSKAKYDAWERYNIYPNTPIWTLFTDSDWGIKVIKLDNEYDKLLERFQKQFRENYNPLDGKEYGHSCGVTCTLSVDGVNYDRPYVPPEPPWRYMLIVFVFICFVVLLGVPLTESLRIFATLLVEIFLVLIGVFIFFRIILRDKSE